MLMHTFLLFIFHYFSYLLENFLSIILCGFNFFSNLIIMCISCHISLQSITRDSIYSYYFDLLIFSFYSKYTLIFFFFTFFIDYTFIISATFPKIILIIPPCNYPNIFFGCLLLSDEMISVFLLTFLNMLLSLFILLSTYL